MSDDVRATVTHAEFAMMSARLAQKAAAWAADCLILPGSRNEPMRADVLERFTKEMQDMIASCNGR